MKAPYRSDVQGFLQIILWRSWVGSQDTEVLCSIQYSLLTRSFASVNGRKWMRRKRKSWVTDRSLTNSRSNRNRWVHNCPSQGCFSWASSRSAPGGGYSTKGLFWFLVEQCDCQKCDSAAGKAQVAEDRRFKATRSRDEMSNWNCINRKHVRFLPSRA